MRLIVSDETDSFFFTVVRMIKKSQHACLDIHDSGYGVGGLTRAVGRKFLLPCPMRIYEMKETVRDMFVEQREGCAGVLCHEYVIHADDVDLVDALRLELVILLDVSRRLRMARRREGPRHADLQRYFTCKTGKRRSALAHRHHRRKNNTWQEGAVQSIRTIMVLPEGASLIGVASVSLTVSISGSLSPGFA